MKTRILWLLALVAILATPVLAKKYSAADDMKKAALAKSAALAELSKPYSADVSVNATKVIRTIPTELFGQNVNVYEGSGDGNDPVYNAAVTSMGTNLMRFPGGGYGELTDWENYKSGKMSWLPIDMAKGIAFAKATNCKLQIIVNTDGNWGDTIHTRQECLDKAARWVKYMNVKPRALYTKYWEVGNENFKDKGYEYAEKYIQFTKAMKAVDPTIKTGCQIQYDHPEWTVDILKTLKKAGVRPDFWIVHTYPIWFPVPGRKASDAPSWDKKLYATNPYEDTRLLDLGVSFPEEANEKLENQIANNYDPKAVGKIPIFVTEFRSVLEYKYDEMVDTLFCAQYLLTIGQMGYSGANIWALKNGFSKDTGCDYGLLRTGVNADFPDDNPKSTPRPTYYIYPFLSRVFGRDMVKCKAPAYAPMESEGNKLRAWASKDKEGNLTVFLVNNNPLSPVDANVRVAGFPSGTAGRSWTFEPVGKTLDGEDEPVLQRRDLSINGVTRPDPTTLPGEGKPVAVGNTFKVQIPPVSMMLVKIPKGNGPALEAPVEEEKPKAEAAVTTAAVAPSVKLNPGQMVLQEFTTDDKGVYSPWKDDKGSVLSYVLEDVKPEGKSGEKMITIKYNQVAGGWCGLFCRAGEDWSGMAIGKPKSLEIKLYCEKPVAFGLSLDDDAKNEIKVEVPMTQGDKKWQTITVPVTVPDAFKGTVNGFNLYMMSPGEGTFSIDRISVTK